MLFAQLEALELLSFKGSLPGLRNIFDSCDPRFGSSPIIRVAILRALKGMFAEEDAQEMFAKALESKECEQTKTVFEMLWDASKGPDNYGFQLPPTATTLNERLSNIAITTSEALTANHTFDICLLSVLKDHLFFHGTYEGNTEEQQKALEILTRATLAAEYGSDEEGESVRSKRAVNLDDLKGWTHSDCENWGNPDGNNNNNNNNNAVNKKLLYDAIETGAQFRQDRDDYPMRRHCLGHKQVGVEKIHADFFAGIFAGRGAEGGATARSSSSSSMYKLFQKFVATGTFYNIPFEIG